LVGLAIMIEGGGLNIQAYVVLTGLPWGANPEVADSGSGLV